jgi:hypothetical protein
MLSIVALGALGTTPAAAQEHAPASFTIQLACFGVALQDPVIEEDGDEDTTVFITLHAAGEDEQEVASGEFEVLHQDWSWTFDAEAAHAGLVEADLDVRMQFVDSLLGNLRHPNASRKDARSWLTERAKGKDELAWTSRLLLRDLDQMTLHLPDALDDLSNELFLVEQLEARGKLRALRFGAHGASSDEGAEGSLEAWIDSAGNGAGVYPMAKIPGQELVSIELRLTPSGARLRILEPPHIVRTVPQQESHGEEQIWTTQLREYVGPDLVTILSANPDLTDRLPFVVRGTSSRSAFVIRRDVLGVYAQPPTVEDELRFGLAKDVGLQVVRIEPGTIAHCLGVSPGSIVLEVCGMTVRGKGGIADAFQCGPGSEVCVVWLDSSGRRQERTWQDGAVNVIAESFAIIEGEPEVEVTVEVKEVSPPKVDVPAED